MHFISDFAFAYSSLQFVPYLSEIAFPLTAMLREKVFKWDEIHERAWLKLKSVIAADISLTIPTPEDNLVISVDASKVGVSCILWVERDKGLKPVMCFSKLLSLADSQKPIFFKETISLALGLKAFRPYLYRTTKPVVCLTDCRGLLFIGRNRFTNIKCQSLADFIALQASMYKLNLYHIPGRLNILADLLSRNIVESRYLTGNTILSKKQAACLPQLPDPFVADSDSLYHFLTTNIVENEDPGTTVSAPTAQKIDEIFEQFKKTTAEEKYMSAIRLLEQNVDVSAGTDFSSEKKSASSQAKTIMEEKFSDILLPSTFKTQIKNSLAENILKSRKSFKKSELYNITNKVTFSDTIDYYNDNMSSGLIKSFSEREQISKNCKKVSFQEADSRSLQSTDIQPIVPTNRQTDIGSGNSIPPDNYLSTQDRYQWTGKNLTVSQTDTKSVIFYQIDPKIIKPCHPITNYSGSYGIDLPLQSDFDLKPNQQLIVDTAIKFNIPPNFFGQIHPRSSTAKRNILVFSGCIDRDYNSTVKLLIKNASDSTVVLKKGERLAQIFFHLVYPPYLAELEGLEIRGLREKGDFGSSDLLVNKSTQLYCNIVFDKSSIVTGESKKFLNVNMHNIDIVDTKCNVCNFDYTVDFVDQLADRSCCSTFTNTQREDNLTEILVYDNI